MRQLAQHTRGIGQLIWLNTDRILAQLLIVAALVLAGWLFGLSQPLWTGRI